MCQPFVRNARFVAILTVSGFVACNSTPSVPADDEGASAAAATAVAPPAEGSTEEPPTAPGAETEEPTPEAATELDGAPALELQNVGSPPEGYEGPEPPRPPFRVTRPHIEPSFERTLSEMGDLTAILRLAYLQLADDPQKSIAAITWVTEQEPLHATTAVLLAMETGDIDAAFYAVALSRWGNPSLLAMPENERTAALRADPRWPQVEVYREALIEFWRQQPALSDTVVHPAAGDAAGILATMRDELGVPFSAVDLQALADATGRTVIDVAPVLRNGPRAAEWFPFAPLNHRIVMEAVTRAGLAQDDQCVPIVAAGFAGQIALEMSLSSPGDYCGVFAIEPFRLGAVWEAPPSRGAATQAYALVRIGEDPGGASDTAENIDWLESHRSSATEVEVDITVDRPLHPAVLAHIPKWLDATHDHAVFVDDPTLGFALEDDAGAGPAYAAADWAPLSTPLTDAQRAQIELLHGSWELDSAATVARNALALPEEPPDGAFLWRFGPRGADGFGPQGSAFEEPIATDWDNGTNTWAVHQAPTDTDPLMIRTVDRFPGGAAGFLLAEIIFEDEDAFCFLDVDAPRSSGWGCMRRVE